jgi:hypothetical protein
MVLSTMFTLVLVPTMFSLWMDAKVGLLALLGREPKELNGNGYSDARGDEAASKHRVESLRSRATQEMFPPV